MSLILKLGKTTKVTKAVEGELKDMLSSWAKLQSRAPMMTEEELLKALHLEAKGENRPKVTKYLLGRITSTLRNNARDALAA